MVYLRISKSTLSAEPDGTVLRLMQSANGLTKYAQRVAILPDEEHEKIEHHYPGPSFAERKEKSGLSDSVRWAFVLWFAGQFIALILWQHYFVRSWGLAGEVILYQGAAWAITLLPSLAVCCYALWHFRVTERLFQEYLVAHRAWVLQRDTAARESIGLSWSELSFDAEWLVPGTALVVPQSVADSRTYFSPYAEAFNPPTPY